MDRELMSGDVLEDPIVGRRRPANVMLGLLAVHRHTDLQPFHPGPPGRDRPDRARHDLGMDAHARQDRKQRVELANAFGELTDAAEQRVRFEIAMAEKQRIHNESYPVDDDFLDALARMPQASGIALGFDRLVMMATGAERIDEVIWAPVAEP
jgi:hypothetical protein